MKTSLAAVALVILAGTAGAETVRIDTVQSAMPINYPVYAPVAQAPVVVQSPVVVEQPVMAAPAVVAPAPIMPAPVVTYSPYYAPYPVYYPAVRARTIVRPWGARTVYRYW